MGDLQVPGWGFGHTWMNLQKPWRASGFTLTQAIDTQQACVFTQSSNKEWSKVLFNYTLGCQVMEG